MSGERGEGRTGIRKKNSRKKEYHVHLKSQFLRRGLTPNTAVIWVYKYIREADRVIKSHYIFCVKYRTQMPWVVPHFGRYKDKRKFTHV